MNIKKFAIAGAVAVTTFAAVAGVAVANNHLASPMNLEINNNGKAHITGKVTSVSGSTIGVASWGGTWSVNAANASFLPKNTNGLADIHVGDTVRVLGSVVSGMTIDATSVHNKSLTISPETATSNSKKPMPEASKKGLRADFMSWLMNHWKLGSR